MLLKGPEWIMNECTASPFFTNHKWTGYLYKSSNDDPMQRNSWQKTSCFIKVNMMPLKYLWESSCVRSYICTRSHTCFPLPTQLTPTGLPAAHLFPCCLPACLLIYCPPACSHIGQGGPCTSRWFGLYRDL